MKKKAIVLLGISLFGSILGFLREIVTANYFGVSLELELFLIATIFATLVFPRLSRAITASYIPLYVKYKKENRHNELESYIYNLVNKISLLSSLIYFLLFIILYFFSIKTDNDKLYLMFLLLTPTTYFILINGFQIGKFQAKEKFFRPAIAGLFINFVMIVSVYFAYIASNIFIMIIGVIIYVFLQYNFLQEKILNRIKNKEPEFKVEFLRNLRPTIISALAPIIPLFMIRGLNGFYNVGSIPAFNYAYLITGLPPLLFGMSMLTVLVPKFSQVYLAKENINKFMDKVIFCIVLIILPVQIIILLNSERLITLFFVRGQFGERELTATSEILVILSIGILAVLLRETLIRFSLAVNASRAAEFNSLLYLIMSVLITFLGSLYFGIKGAAFAIVIVEFLSVIFFLFKLKENIHIKKILALVLVSIGTLLFLYVKSYL